MSDYEIKKVAANKVYKILCGEKIRVPFSEILDGTIKTANGKVKIIIDLDLKNIKINKNLFYNFFNVEVSYANKTVTFTYDVSELDNSTQASEKEIQNIIDKINKLLSVTEERGATENEAIQASLKAQMLMKKYSIEYAKIKNNEGEEIYNLNAETPNGNKWKYGFAVSVATSYCCHVFVCGNTITFRGYKSDILIARRVFMYLYDTCVRLGKEERRKGNDYTSFCVGFTKGVAERLSSNCKALALTTPQEVEKDWKEYTQGCKSKTVSFRTLDNNSYNKGKAEGRKAVDGQFISSSNKANKKSETLLIGAH